MHDCQMLSLLCTLFRLISCEECGSPWMQVFSWGRNFHGQLGLADRFERRTPTLVDSLWALPVKQLAAGDSHSAALTRSGYLFTWGYNQQGQLGIPPDAEHAALANFGRSSSSRRKLQV